MISFSQLERAMDCCLRKPHARGACCQNKYLVGNVWARHLHYTHNLDGEPPPAVVKATKKVKFTDGE